MEPLGERLPPPRSSRGHHRRANGALGSIVLGWNFKSYSFDYVIGSAHYVGDFNIDASAEGWSPYSRRDVDDIILGY